MAIFEKTSQTKVVVDDTETLTCNIENTQNINKHTEYNLKVSRGPTHETKWNVSHRYSDFALLHSCLQHSNVDLPLPPKKLIGNLQPSFIAERQVALQNYIEEILKNPILSLSFHVRNFLDPFNYPLNLAEQVLQTVSIALRGHGRFELKGQIQDIGWRVRKKYFLVNDIESQSNCLLSYQSYGPDRYLCDKDMQGAFKSLQRLSHPYIDEILAIHNLETGAYVVRRIHENGSVRDMLYGTDYSKSYLAKYGRPRARKPFTVGQLSHYGKRILEALKFLHDKGLTHGHLHPGNIAIQNQRVLLMDIENSLIGTSCIYRPYILEHKKAHGSEAVDVYCFGRTLYEMALAEPLEETYREQFPSELPYDLTNILWLCLSPMSSKHQLPTLEDLLRHPFFNQPLSLSNGVCETWPHLKFPTALKDELRKAALVIETRIRSEKKMIRSAKREVRIQSLLSVEEIKRQKKKMKKRHSLWKSTSSLADTVRSQSVSTSSSPTPPRLPTETSSNGNISSVPSTSPANDGRSALLSAICSFDKSRLARINSR